MKVICKKLTGGSYGALEPFPIHIAINRMLLWSMLRGCEWVLVVQPSKTYKVLNIRFQSYRFETLYVSGILSKVLNVQL